MKEITYAEFARRRQQENLRLIDVREADEFAAVHVIGAELHPLSDVLKGELPAADGRIIAIICRSGARSARAAQIFEQAGLGECINIAGGTLAAEVMGPDHVTRG